MDTLLQTMSKYALEHKVPVIGRDSAAILTAVVAAKQPAAVLEIGTAIGYSALLMARNMPPGGRIATIEIDPERAATARRFIARSEFADRIGVYVGDAAAIAAGLAGGFDLVFIDAAKGQYLNYLEQVLDKLAPEAVVVADNVLFRGWVRGGNPPRRFRTIVERLRRYLAFVSTDHRFTTTIYPVGDGIAVSFYREEQKLEKN